MTNLTNLTDKELSIVRILSQISTLSTNYEGFKSLHCDLKPKSYVGVINSLKKKGQVTIDGIGIRAMVTLI
jgi:hypothetical protein